MRKLSWRAQYQPLDTNLPFAAEGEASEFRFLICRRVRDSSWPGLRWKRYRARVVRLVRMLPEATAWGSRRNCVMSTHQPKNNSNCTPALPNQHPECFSHLLWRIGLGTNVPFPSGFAYFASSLPGTSVPGFHIAPHSGLGDCLFAML